VRHTLFQTFNIAAGKCDTDPVYLSLLFRNSTLFLVLRLNETNIKSAFILYFSFLNLHFYKFTGPQITDAGLSIFKPITVHFSFQWTKASKIFFFFNFFLFYHKIQGNHTKANKSGEEAQKETMGLIDIGLPQSKK